MHLSEYMEPEHLASHIEHESFLALQKIIQGTTPRAILEALSSGNTSVLDTWTGQTNEPVGRWVQEWIAKLNGKYGEILLTSKRAFETAIHLSTLRKDFAVAVRRMAPEYASVCFAMMDDKNHKPIIWKLVEKHFEKELCQPFAVEADVAV